MALITWPKWCSDWLMAQASFSCRPEVCALLCRSDPARSTRLSFALRWRILPRSSGAQKSIDSVSTEWERLELRLAAVAATDLFLSPCVSSARHSAAEETGVSVRLET